MSKQRNRITKSGAGEASSKGVAPRVEKPGLIRKLSYARWVPAHAWQQLTRPTERGIVHLIFALADHFEASIVQENGRAGAPLSQQERRVKQWSSEYPRSVDRCRDHEGQPFVHTYFYPAEQYDRGLVDCLAEHCHGGWGELEVHLHHGMDGPDTAENTSQQLVEFRDALVLNHGSRCFLDGSDQARYAFVHGNFALANSAGGYADFWRRWHISLSTWLRDYLYIPLGGNRYGELKTYRNLLLTMLLGGLWHGANWTFVVWGGLHGGGLAVERKLTRGVTAARAKLPRWMKRILIFHFVCLSWIFFRAPSLRAAWEMLKGLGVWSWRPEFPAAFLFLAIFSIPLLLVDLYLESTGDEYCFASATVQPRVAFGLACALVIALLGANQANAFIYFQF